MMRGVTAVSRRRVSPPGDRSRPRNSSARADELAWCLLLLLVGLAVLGSVGVGVGQLPGRTVAVAVTAGRRDLVGGPVLGVVDVTVALVAVADLAEGVHAVGGGR